MTSHVEDPALRPKLDTTFFSLEADELEFFRRLTSIQDEEQLKAHVVDVQTKAYQIHGYNCIRRFNFVKLKIARLPAYKQALNLLHEQNNPIFLDIGCCFGNDIRKAVLDGWPVKNAVASDLRKGQTGFWDYGHELFKSSPKSFSVAFIPGDVFDSSMLSPRGAFLEADEIKAVLASTAPALQELASLTPLQGKVSTIHASALFHLFDEEQQLVLAHRLASLISPQKGSIILGQHGSRPEKGYRVEATSQVRLAEAHAAGAPVSEYTMFCHSPDSWKDMWINDVFRGSDDKGDKRVKVEAELVEVKRRDLLDHTNASESTRFYVMNWSVTLL